MPRAVIPGRLPARRGGVGSVSRQGPAPLEGGRRRWRLLRRPRRTKRGRAGRALGAGTGPGKHRVILGEQTPAGLGRAMGSFLGGGGRWVWGGGRRAGCDLTRCRDFAVVTTCGGTAPCSWPRRQGGICPRRPKGSGGQGAPNQARCPVPPVSSAGRAAPPTSAANSGPDVT